MARCHSLQMLVLLFLFFMLQFAASSALDPCPTPFARTFILNENENCSDVSDEGKKHIQSNNTTVLLPLLYLVAFLVGLPANLVALWVLLFRTKKQPSTTLLINLTACDLLLLVVLPFRIAYHFQGNDWTLGEPLCRLVMALFYGNMYGSVLCLALIAFDRYLALVHPIGGRALRTYRNSVYMTAAAWAVVLVAMVPLLATQQTYPLASLNITTCHDVLPDKIQMRFLVAYFASLFAVCFVLPLLAVLFCYGSILRALVKAGRRYAHAVRVTALVLTVFLVCLLPSNALLLAHNSYLLWGDQEVGESLYMPYMVTLALSTFNSCLDPFIFYYVSEDFREKARQVLLCGQPEKTPTSSQLETRSSSSSRSKVTLLSTSGRVSVTPEAPCLHGAAA
ncbi:proteinase-activated receptor 4 [Sardina pilchardus]|uniref:proteinase-activated receptor 4 n=1 Tax=Sardina pilchardus TaxID=27697 RepID=UPI002E0FD0CA